MKVTVPGLGLRLRQERERVGLSQGALAEALGLRRMTQYLYEKEQSSPKCTYLQHLSEMGFDLDFILYGERQARPTEPPELRAAMRDAYRIVEKRGQGADGKPLPMEERLNIFEALLDALLDRSYDKAAPHSNLAPRTQIKGR